MDRSVIIALIVVIAVILFLFMVIATVRNKGEKRVTNYRALFIIGISWLPIGIATKNPGLWVVGIVFLIVGIANKDKWKQEAIWADSSPRAKGIKLIFVGGLIMLLLTALAFFIFVGGN